MLPRDISHKFTKLALLCFRNHRRLEIDCDRRFVVIKGLNGAGKTNILEALSLFAPGRGLRNAKFEEALSHGEKYSNEWAAHGAYSYGAESINIVTGYNVQSNKNRCIEIDKQLLKKQSTILDYIRLVWLIPQMDGLFLDAASSRRKFFDRVCYNLYPIHAKHISQYEYYLSARLKILQQPQQDATWLDSIEMQLAKLSVLIYQTRHAVLRTLQECIDISSEDFLKPILKLQNGFAATEPEEGSIKHSLFLNRVLDGRSGRTNFGIHKADLIALHPTKTISAQYCSTGEQKSMLLALILAQAKAIKDVSKISPIILLDEVLAHLDEPKQIKILELLYSLESQVWITTTKSTIDNIIDNNSAIIHLQ